MVVIGAAGAFIWFRRGQRPPAKTKADDEATLQNLERVAGTSSVDEADDSSVADDAEESDTSPPPAPEPATTPAASADSALPISALEPPEDLDSKINILIVDDNPGTRDNVSRLLYFENDMEVIGQAVNGREGIEMASELRPHIVLMDINMPDMDGITATGEMSLKTPYSQVIIMSVQAEQHYMKQAMAAGARDFQPKPFTADELIACIRRVYNRGMPIYRQIEAIEHAQNNAASMPQPDRKEEN
ncbi:MAG: response regulator transcription factor, partial [Anaerolineae bacterium]|nr:response regulator transcription factor [Anaerolineae bacterium]